MATVINSNPATFTTLSAGTTRCTFAIPAGQWTSAQWASNGTWSAGGSLVVNTVVSGSNGVTLGTHGSGGTYNDSIAATAAQLADINAVAGSTLHAEHNTSGFTDAVTAFTLTLTGSGGVVVVSGNAAQITTYFDSLSTLFAGQYANIGLGAATESGTLAALAQYARKRVLGDGSAAFPGLGNAAWQAAVRPYFEALVTSLRYDTLFAARCRAMVTTLDGLILNNLPAGWKFIAAGGLTHALDAHLMRINGGYNAPATPAAAGTLTATNSATGALPTTTASNAPRVVHTLVGTYDYNESLPSAEATQVAIAAPNNAYTYQIAGSVPVGVTKVRLYRSLFAGSAGGPYFWDQDVPVIAGSAYPAIPIKQGDSQLRLDWNPPVWLSALMAPEAALIVALAYATACNQIGGQGCPLQLQANGMLSPTNVALSPANAFLGLGNPPQAAQFGARTVGSAYAPYGFQTSNNAAANVQGFAGGMGLQARVTTALNGTLTLTPTYTYYDAAHGWGSPQTDTAAGVAFGSTAAGTLIVFSVPAGRLVQSVTGDTNSGTATSGAYLYEAPFVRMY